MKALLFLEPRLLKSEKQLTDIQKKRRMCCICDCYHDTDSAFRPFGDIREEMEEGERTFLSVTAAPASSYLPSFLHENGDLENGFKSLTCKMYRMSRCAVANDHQ